MDGAYRNSLDFRGVIARRFPGTGSVLATGQPITGVDKETLRDGIRAAGGRRHGSHTARSSVPDLLGRDFAVRPERSADHSGADKATAESFNADFKRGTLKDRKS
ncbi:hypothetical protein [Streptomyces sp. NPDC001880]